MKFQSVAIASAISSLILRGTAMPVPVNGPIVSMSDPQFQNELSQLKNCGVNCLARVKREPEPELESDLVSPYLSNTLHDRQHRANGIRRKRGGTFMVVAWVAKWEVLAAAGITRDLIWRWAAPWEVACMKVVALGAPMALAME